MAANITPIKRRGGRYETELVVFKNAQFSANDSTGFCYISNIGQVDEKSIIHVEFSGVLVNASGLSRFISYTIFQQEFAAIALTEAVSMPSSATNKSAARASATLSLRKDSYSKIESIRTTPSVGAATRSVVASNLATELLFDGKKEFDFKLGVSFGSDVTAGWYFNGLNISITRFVRF